MRAHLIISLSLLAWVFSPLYGQYGLRFSNIEHSGVYGEVFQPAIVPQAMKYLSEIDDAFQVGAGIGFMVLQTKQDTFFNYTVKVSGTTTILPSYEIYENVKFIPIDVFFAYRPLENKWRPVMGVALGANLFWYDYQNKIETVLDSREYNKELYSIGLMPFLGGSYQLGEKWLFQLEVGHQFAFDTSRNWHRSWRTSLTSLYYLY